MIVLIVDYKHECCTTIVMTYESLYWISDTFYYWQNAVNDKSYAREKLCGFRRFLMNCKSFPTNAMSNGSTFITDEAKVQKFYLHLDEIQ